MPEEMRFFLRTALHTAGITLIYWAVSREWAGTVMLTFLFLASLFFIFAGSSLARNGARSTSGSAVPQRGSVLRRAVGFDAEGEDPGAPLKIEDGEFPGPSLWPLGAALAATLVGLGLIYGAWLWIPGVSLGLATGTAWLTHPAP